MPKMTVPLLDLRRQYQTFKSDLLPALERVCDSQMFILGPEVTRLEVATAAYCHSEHGIGVSSGTDALLLALMGLDIGPASTELFKGAISDARTIFWNGPMGVFEMTPFETGTKEVALAVARNNRAVSVVGGGDSVAALKKFDLEERVTFVSTGGGASMKLLEGAKLPGLEALLDR